MLNKKIDTRKNYPERAGSIGAKENSDQKGAVHSVGLSDETPKVQVLNAEQMQTRHLVRERLLAGNLSPLRINENGKYYVIEDMAVVVCFWGQNDLYTAAVRKALACLVDMAPFATIFFVEAQFTEDSFVFESFSDKLNYTRIALEDGHRGMFMKECLWNIGAKKALENSSITKILFLDADCSYIHQDALKNVSETLDTCDVCSGHSYSYYSDQTDSPAAVGLKESVCLAWLEGGKADGHSGFSLGMTRAFFDRIDGLPAFPTLAGDTWFWLSVFGLKRRTMQSYQAPYNYGNITGMGLFPFPTIGCSGEIICHHWHGTMKNRLYFARRIISRATTTAIFEDRKIDENGLQVWSDTAGAKIARECHLELDAAVAKDAIPDDQCAFARNIYNTIAEKHYGSIDEEHPLVISTAFRAGGPYTKNHVVLLRDLFAKFCLTPHTFVCVTNEKIDGVDCRPFITAENETPYYYCQLELYRKDLYPKNASVLTCDLDAIPIRPFTMHRCPDGTISMGHELHNWNLSLRVVWNGGVTYFNGDFGYILDDFINESKVNGPSHPFFTFISSQEYMAGNLYKHGVAIHDLLAHLPFEFYCAQSFNPQSTTALVHFLFQPKPWTLKNRPSWLPQEAFSAGGGGAYQSTGATKP